ncbi:hypothetical protein RHGRI_014517 [Rhododendron griersonianum]|uniref:Uncharacterized protein n=1 Tax=Rhododendron griersonianum TaxID=479676 RepID=A0AAV6KA09_9ERIC|nr:hypothetical protein RHGRI_014517 [Rhododendron griersonianum]
MDRNSIVFALIGFSASFFLCLPNLKKWQSKKIRREKLGMITEALEKAEERVKRHEERHDRILGQICSHYLLNRDLEEALAAARAALNEALEFAAGLRGLQMKLISSHPSGS